MRTAFTLREDYAGTVELDGGEQVPAFQGGVLAHGPDRRSFDVRAKLEEGNGTIVVESTDEELVELLRHYPPLKEVPVPEDAPLQSGYDDAPVVALRAEAERRGLSKAGTKAQLVERLQAHDEAVASGDQEGAADPTPEDDNDDQGA